MAAPVPLPNPVRDTKDIRDEKAVDAYQHGYDADLVPTQDTFNKDIEKGVQSISNSIHSENQTLEGEAPAQEQERDPDIVDWDGPDDPQNPQNWTPGKKWQIIAALGFITLITYVAFPPTVCLD